MNYLVYYGRGSALQVGEVGENLSQPRKFVNEIRSVFSCRLTANKEKWLYTIIVDVIVLHFDPKETDEEIRCLNFSRK
jgi:hypothetical protein